ncbi:MAG: ABC transporter ATP-binding protein [Acidobacteria bacterium]|nr:ABC transporter ATP-binding protein [Acidobacteriota bacterium]
MHALEDVSFAMRPGEVVGVVGESGSGKSTLALSLLRLLPPGGQVVRGAVELDARDLLALEERELERIRGAEVSLIWQEPGIALNPVMRVRDQVGEIIRAHHSWNQQRCTDEANATLALVFPSDTARIGAAYPHQLSGGQRQRVLIAQALSCHPKLIVADEPTASLDAVIQAEILELLRDLKQRLNLSLIVITHNPGILVGLADRVLVMYAGRVVEEGPAARVYSASLHPYTRGLLRAVPHPAAEGGAGQRARLQAIEGNPPDLGRLPAGCAFEPRCPDRMAACAEREPAEVSPDAVSKVRCFKYGG